MADVTYTFNEWSPSQQRRMTRDMYVLAMKAFFDPVAWERVQRKKEELARQGRLPPPDEEGGEHAQRPTEVQQCGMVYL